MKKWLKSKWTLTGAAIVVILLGLAMVGPIMSNVEKPDYKVVAAEGQIEVRRYPTLIAAEVTTTGDRDEAISAGFRLLADYIFGNNTKSSDIAMTAPVTQEASSEKIDMTAPVTQQPTAENTWNVRFIMPSEYTMETLPKPNNDKVNIKKIPAKTYAAIKFSGSKSEKNLRKHEEKLMAYIEASNMEPVSPPVYAFYNPPWTLPFLRRNEVMYEVSP